MSGDKFEPVVRRVFVPVFRWDIENDRIVGLGVEVKVPSAPAWKKLLKGLFGVRGKMVEIGGEGEP